MEGGVSASQKSPIPNIHSNLSNLLVFKYLNLKMLVWALTKSHCIGMSNFVGTPSRAEEAPRCRSARAEEAHVLKKHTCWRRTQRIVLNKHNWKKQRIPVKKHTQNIGKNNKNQAAGNQQKELQDVHQRMSTLFHSSLKKMELTSFLVVCVFFCRRAGWWPACWLLFHFLWAGWLMASLLAKLVKASLLVSRSQVPEVTEESVRVSWFAAACLKIKTSWRLLTVLASLLVSLEATRFLWPPCWS